MSNAEGRQKSSVTTNSRPSHRNSNAKPNIRPSLRSQIQGDQPEKRQIVGQYMLGKTIGEGTFGKVKLAVHIPTGEKVYEINKIYKLYY